MDVAWGRVILSASIGIVLTLLLVPLLTNRADKALAERVASAHPWAMLAAKWLGIGGFASALLLYILHVLPKNDWRGLGLGMGVGVLLPLPFLAWYARRMKVSFKLLCVASWEGANRVLVGIIYALFLVAGAVSAVSLLVQFVFRG